MACALLAALLWAAPAAASVLIVTTDGVVEADAAEQALVGTGLLDPADFGTFSSSGTPALSVLEAFDVVLLWGTTPWASPASLGDVLADYVEGGGAVVLAAGALNTGVLPTGRFATSHSPIVAAAPGSVAGNVNLAASNASHPVLEGLSDLRFADVGQGDPSLSGLGVHVAADSAGNLVVAATCDRRAIAVNVHPPSLADGEPANSADAARMLAQALLATELDAAASPDAGGPYTVPEGGQITLDGSGTGTGDLGPLTLSWDRDGDGQVDDGSGSSPAFDAGSLDGPQTLTIGLRSEDACGRLESASTTLEVEDVAPVLVSLSASPAGLLGDTLSFAAEFADEPFDPLTLSWDWDDGSPTETGAAVSHSWVAPGSYEVLLRAEDDEGLGTTLTLPVLITNAGPSLELVQAPAALDEGELATWAVTAVDAFGQAVELSWDFGDGDPAQSGSDLVEVDRAFADEGAYEVVVSASDSFGGATELNLPVTVANVAPTVGVAPFASVVEGTAADAALEAVDPGEDLLEWTALVLPPGASLASGGQLSWTPDFAAAELGTASFDVLVRDGDGGSDRLTWSASVAFLDADGDGLPDTWELEHDLDPTVDDAGEDPDGDGLSNAEEWAQGSDPTSSDAPPAPIPLEPAADAVVATRTPTLVALEDGGGDTVELEFEVHGAASLLDLLTAGTAPATPSGLVSWLVDVELDENIEVFWRVRAVDVSAPGPWTELQSFFVDEVNDPPSVPTPSSPDGGTVQTATPLLVAAASSDPEGDAIEVTFHVYADDGALVQSIQAAEQPGGTWAGSPHSPLTEDVDYSWTAQAQDERGAESSESDVATFHLDVTNSAPPAPAWTSPLADELDTATPTLGWTVDDDPDGDPIVLRVQWGDDPAAGIADEATVEPEGGVASLALDDALEENARTLARVRSEDDWGAVSAWVSVDFVVDAVEEDPGTPVVIEPADGAIVAGDAVSVRWAPTEDPDDDSLLYAVRIVRDGLEPEDGEAAWSANELAAGDLEGSAAVDVELESGGWRVLVQATDSTGRSGDWSAAPRFTVAGAEPGEGVDLGPGDGEGWVCSVAGEPGLSALALLLVFRIGRRRRRKSAR